MLHIKTPLIKSVKLSSPDKNVWLKLDALQPAGSFKNRGVGFACEVYVSQGAKYLISSSGGNAGIATAYAGLRLSTPVKVVVPETTSIEAIAAIRDFDAEVLVHGSSWLEAHELAKSLADEYSVLIHPFDDPLLWPGHATLIDEIIETGCEPDAIVLSVGGGGLLCGVAHGLEKNRLGKTEIIAVETRGAASLNAAVKAGRPTMLDNINTIASSLGAKQISDAAFEITRSFNVTSHIVSDKDALSACWRFLDDHRLLVEPACGAALAAVYNFAQALRIKKEIVVVVCGGMGVSIAQLENWDKRVNGQYSESSDFSSD